MVEVARETRRSSRRISRARVVATRRRASQTPSGVSIVDRRLARAERRGESVVSAVMDFVQDVTPELASSRFGVASASNASAGASAGGALGGASADGARKSGRARKISKALRRVDAATRAEVAAARLDSFESDVAIVPGTTGEGEGEDEDDDEFVFNENARDGEAVIVKGKKKAGKRTTRGVAENRRAVAARTFNALLEQSFIDRAPEGTPTYLTAAAGPSKASAPRKFCSVCGFQAPYGCARCGMRFCSKKCSAVHAETRCLKMVG